MKKKILELGASAIQKFDPTKGINLHMCGFAFYNNEPKRQVELHHYCHSVNDEVIQCAVYESDEADARLIGIEYVISKRLFDGLPPSEQMLWHSHLYDVKSGSFITPGLPNTLEKTILQDVTSTYGKTWILWQVDRGDVLPVGMPELMMVATKDGEWDPNLFLHRDKKKGYNSEERRKLASTLESPPVNSNADGWKKGLKISFHREIPGSK